MGKNTHKKLRRSFSPSNEEQSSKKPDATKKYTTVKRKKDIKHDECYASKREKEAFPVEVSQGSCQTKKSLYKLKAPSKEVKSSSISSSVYGENYSVKDKDSVGGVNTIEKGSLEPFRVSSSQRQATSQGSCDDRSCHRIPSNVKRPLYSEHEQKTPKKHGKKRKRSRNEKKRNAKTKEPIKAESISKKLLLQEKRRLLKDFCAKRTRREAETSSASSLSKNTTSGTKSILNTIENGSPVKSAPHKSATSESSKQAAWPAGAIPLSNFKIPKVVRQHQAENTAETSSSESSNANCEHANELFKSETAHPSSICHDGCHILSREKANERSSSSSRLTDASTTVSHPKQDETQVVQELHLARSKKCLEVNVTHRYGELTCMDIDLTEDETDANNLCRQPSQQDLILVLDTNILLSHLDYIRNIRSHGLSDKVGVPVILIPWVVLQELDFLKRGKDLSGSVAHLAIPAISYIYNTLKNREPRLWGQSMQQAAESSYGLKAENNDDRVLQCCLQYHNLYPGCALILCTNDKNLCSKALLCGIKAFSRKDLESEVKGFNDGLPLHNLKTSTISHTSHQASLPAFENKLLRTREVEEKTKWDVSRGVCVLEECLRDVLSDVVEMEMKAVYDDLWLEVVYRKPPWTLQDLLQCLKKHWIAVFGQIIQRKKLQLVLNLIDFFQSRKTVDCGATSDALQAARELVKAFELRSSRVPRALSTIDSIFSKLQPQSDSAGSDVVMNDDSNDDGQPTTSPASPQEVWALFEKIWSSVIEASMNVFKVLGFDPHTMQSSQPVGGLSPPQEALVFLSKLSSTISQLLQAFSSILSSGPGSKEVQMLLTVIKVNEIVNVDSRFTAKDFCDCFSQQEYREKLRVGGNQLLELKGTLDRCAGTHVGTDG